MDWVLSAHSLADMKLQSLITRLGEARLGWAWRGEVQSLNEKRGGARPGEARRGAAWRGVAGRGVARQGIAR